MSTAPFTSWAARFAPHFERRVPRAIDAAWLERFVDHPRFGWDLQGLDLGFTQPLYRFVDRQPLAAPGAPLGPDSRFLRAALACALVPALPAGAAADPLAFDLELTALELHAVASTMLDHLANGRDLASSRGQEQQLALPVLITVAYSARQLAASMAWDHSALPPERRRRLAQRFARLLLLQGIGHTLDIWGAEARLQHGNAADLADHLRWYVTPLDFELPCELAAAVAGLDGPASAALVQAGGDLGLAWHAGLARARLHAELAASAPPLRWRALAAGALPEALDTIASAGREAALAAAARCAPAVAQVFEQFLAETLAPAGAAVEVA